GPWPCGHAGHRGHHGSASLHENRGCACGAFSMADTSVSSLTAVRGKKCGITTFPNYLCQLGAMPVPAAPGLMHEIAHAFARRFTRAEVSRLQQRHFLVHGTTTEQRSISHASSRCFVLAGTSQNDPGAVDNCSQKR